MARGAGTVDSPRCSALVTEPVRRTVEQVALSIEGHVGRRKTACRERPPSARERSGQPLREGAAAIDSHHPEWLRNSQPARRPPQRPRLSAEVLIEAPVRSPTMALAREQMPPPPMYSRGCCWPIRREGLRPSGRRSSRQCQRIPQHWSAAIALTRRASRTPHRATSRSGRSAQASPVRRFRSDVIDLLAHPQAERQAAQGRRPRSHVPR